MSARPIEIKRRRRAIKSLRRTPPAFFDIVRWLVDHRHANTQREAREMILAGRVKSDSHPLGILKDQTVATRTALGTVKIERKDTVNPYIPVAVKGRITVLPA